MNRFFDITKEWANGWDVSKLTPEERDGLVARIEHLLYQAVLVRSLDILSTKEQEDLDILMNTDTTLPTDALLFLSKKIPTFTLLLREEADRLKADLIA